MTPLIVATALSLLAAQASQASQTPAAVPATVPRTPSGEPDPVICRYEQITGSHFLKRICLRKSGWEEWTSRTERWTRTFGEQAATQAAQSTVNKNETQGGGF